MKDEDMLLPENTHLGMFDYTAIDGARAAKQVIEQMYEGNYSLDEKLFKRDFLPIMLGEVLLTDEVMGAFSEAWKAVAGALQSCLIITRNGKAVYSVPPIFSAHGAVLTDTSSMGADGIRLNIEVVQAYLSRYNDRNTAMNAYTGVVFNKLPNLKVNPTYLKMWENVLVQCGEGTLLKAVTMEAAKSNDISHMLEEGDDV